MSQTQAPLYSTDAEMSVLGAVLVDKGAAAKVTAALQPAAFYLDAHQVIMAAVQRLMTQGDPVDLVTVSNLLRQEAALDKVGGAAYLAELANSVHTLANVEHHAAIIADKARLRRIDRESLALSTALNQGDDPAARINELRKAIDDEPTNSDLRIWSAKEIMDAPDIAWQIDGYLPMGGFYVLYGPPGSAKTFMALKLSLCIASGHEFLGRRTIQAPVLYVANEGSGGLNQRLRAWHAYESEEPVEHFHIVRDTIDLRDPQSVTRLITKARAIQGLGMIVFDTFARSIPGGDENSAMDIGLAIAQITRIQRETGAAVMVVHHSTKASPNTERGSGALRGAADTLISLTPEGNLKSLTCEKQKDGAPFGPSTWTLQEVGSSCVIVPSSADASEETGDDSQKRKRELTPIQRRIIDALGRHEGGLTKSEVTKVTGIEFSTVKTTIDRLFDRGLLVPDSTGKIWRRKGTQLQLHPYCVPASLPHSDRDAVAQTELHPSPGEMCSIPAAATVQEGRTLTASLTASLHPWPPGGGGPSPFPPLGGESEAPAEAPPAGPATGSEKFTNQEDL